MTALRSIRQDIAALNHTAAAIQSYVETRRQIDAAAAKRTYTVVRDNAGYFTGYNVMDDQTQSMMRDEPFELERKAQELWEQLTEEASDG